MAIAFDDSSPQALARSLSVFFASVVTILEAAAGAEAKLTDTLQAVGIRGAQVQRLGEEIEQAKTAMNTIGSEWAAAQTAHRDRLAGLDQEFADRKLQLEHEYEDYRVELSDAHAQRRDDAIAEADAAVADAKLRTEQAEAKFRAAHEDGQTKLEAGQTRLAALHAEIAAADKRLAAIRADARKLASTPA